VGVVAKIFVALFAEDFVSSSEHVMGATIFWGLLPFERRKCSIYL